MPLFPPAKFFPTFYNPDLVPGLDDHPDDSYYIEKFIHIYSKLPSNLKEAVNQCIAAFDSE